MWISTLLSHFTCIAMVGKGLINKWSDEYSPKQSGLVRVLTEPQHQEVERSDKLGNVLQFQQPLVHEVVHDVMFHFN